MSSADADGVLVLALRAADVPIASDDLASLVDDGVAFAKLIRSALVRIDSVAFKHLPETLPSEDDDANVAERFRVAGAYAEALRTIGYGGDGEIGFQQFLYPSEASARSILKFVLDKLPRKEVEEAISGSAGGRTKNETVGVGSAGQRAIKAVAKSTRAGAAWGKAAKSLGGFAGIAAAARAKKKTDDVEDTQEFRTVRLATEDEAGFFGKLKEGGEASTLASILEYASRSRADTEREEDAQRLKFGGVERIDFIGPDGKPFDLRTRGGLRGLIAEVFKFAIEGGFYAEPKARRARRELETKMDETNVLETAMEVENEALDTLEGRLSARERDVEDIQRRIDEAIAVLSTVDDEIASCAAKVKEALESTDEKRARTAELESNYLLHKQAVGMVLATDRPIEESEAELNKVLNTAKERMEQLKAEWEAAKAPLIAAIEAHAVAASEKRENAKHQLEEIEQWRSEGKETSALLRVKEHEQRQLLEEYEASPKNVHRPSFVRRVNEIIKNIKKQEGEISKIVSDTRSVQTEIQSAEVLLQRTYTVVEETLFREARSDELCRAAYKHLHGMHSDFADLVSKVEATGVARRAQTDLQRKVVEISKQPNNTERVARDLALMKEQIAELEKKLSSSS